MTVTEPTSSLRTTPRAAKQATEITEHLDIDDEQIIIGEAVALDVRPAGFLLRAGSSIIDAIVLYLGLFGILWLLLQWLTTLDRIGQLPDMAMIIALITMTMVTALIGVPWLIETLTRGKSLGRLIFGLRIVRDDGGASGPRQAFIRALLGFFEIYSTSGAIAILVGMFNARAKRLGDILAGTYCVSERTPQLASHTGMLPPQLAHWATIADVARLPDRVSRRILEYLNQAAKLEPGHRRAVAESLARETMRFVHPVPDVDADTFLRGVSVVRRDREYRAMQLSAARRARLDPVLDSLPHGFPHRG